ncbi:MAG: efflux RND transporter periplasmic adaptor subunit [Gammaproteobacteria bacterium]|jgi:biotin carboxyl carrier protein|nr:efflux RND transporter periplasmic adaptor subunit [SAR86 cluster bacterium]|tara:strand:- start:4561 stop:5451 length:891 start_codon:yes stop_codon:yes gene_type:complete
MSKLPIMTKNIRISLYIFIPILFWMVSGIFVSEKEVIEEKSDELFKVEVLVSEAQYFQPLIKLKATSMSEARINVRAKTSGEVVKIGAKQGEFIQKDFILCSLGVVELNRTEVKSPFSGYIENIVKPGNFLERGQVCATIIQLNPIIFIAEVPEFKINKVRVGQSVLIELITGEEIEGQLSFVSKSASNLTKTFKIESEIENIDGKIRDGITAEMTIKTDEILAHKISPSILLLNDKGILGIKTVNDQNIVKFNKLDILEDSEDGLWVSGISNLSRIIIQGQGFVEDGQEVITEIK